MKFLPTGTCFDDSICFFITVLNENPTAFDTASFLLVHAVIQSNVKYAHAWVECKGSVFNSFVSEEREKGIIQLYKREFYSKMNVIHKTAYTPQRVMAMDLKNVSTGPWVAQYKRLCGIGGTVVNGPGTFTVRAVLKLNQSLMGK